MWSGRQAAELGLAGRVDADELEALLEGRDPTRGHRWATCCATGRRRTGRVVRAVAGFDATFSAPKSLSVWWALTGDPGLLDAHDVAVTAALDIWSGSGRRPGCGSTAGVCIRTRSG